MKSKRQVQKEARALWRLCLVHDRLEDDRARLVVDRLLASERADAAAVLRQFIRRVRLESVNRTAVVSSAVPLDPTLQARVTNDLRRLRGQSISTTFVVDSTLIGGMRVKVANDVYDGTVRAGLAALESSLGSVRR